LQRLVVLIVFAVQVVIRHVEMNLIVFIRILQSNALIMLLMMFCRWVLLPLLNVFFARMVLFTNVQSFCKSSQSTLFVMKRRRSWMQLVISVINVVTNKCCSLYYAYIIILGLLLLPHHITLLLKVILS
jgi:hypothetical protein